MNAASRAPWMPPPPGKQQNSVFLAPLHTNPLSENTVEPKQQLKQILRMYLILSGFEYKLQLCLGFSVFQQGSCLSI